MKNKKFLYIRLHSIGEYDEIKKESKYRYKKTIEIDGSLIKNKLDIFDIFSIALKFPKYFGRNWDAFYDCLKDLLWLSSKNNIVLIKNIEILEKDVLENFFDVIIDVHNYWARQGVLFDLVLFTENKNIIKLIKNIEENKEKIYKKIPDYFGHIT